MTIIHMETEHVREVIRMLSQKALELEQVRSNLRSASQRLAMAWQGGRRSERFQRQFETLLRQCEMRAQELQMLARRASSEVQEWEEVDQHFGAFVRRMSQNLAVVAPGAAAPVSMSTTQSFDWFSPVSDAAQWELDGVAHIPYSAWKGMGRWLNQMAGDMKAGWVGKMDGLGHIVKNPAVQHGIPYGLGVVEDLVDGDRWDRALGSEAIEAAAPAVIGGVVGGIIGGISGTLAGGAGAFPGAIAGAEIGAKIGMGVYAVYQTVLGAGSVFSGVLQAAGASQEAQWLQNTIETVDIGEHIGDGVYDAIYYQFSGPAS